MKGFSNYIFNKLVGFYINFLCYINPNKAIKIVYAIFSQPKKGRLSKNNLPKVLHDSQLETFNHNGYSIQSYVWKGNESVILLAHGWESNASRWEKILPFLKKSGSTIVAIDAPAHGLSSGKEFTVFSYAEFIHVVSEKFKPNILIGHSLGGHASLYYQSVYQNHNLKKIVILGSPCDLNVILKNFNATFGFMNKVAKEFENHFYKNFNIKIDDFSGIHFASKIKTKGLVAHDSEDNTVLIDEGKKIANSWKNSVFMETNGIGHSMQNDAFYSKIATYLFEKN
jgi:alpha-beta hydrolase superfamily lysophospholipase